jgi:hypothetical protein
MGVRNCVSYLLAGAMLWVAPAGALAQAVKPVRHLVYAFTWGATTDLEMNTAGFGDDGDNQRTGGAPSGMADSTAQTGDKGTITVDVLGERPDRGLVIDVSEQAQGRRSAPRARCVVFGNTNMVCESNAKVNPEEVELIRLLGPTFIDPTQIDPKQHWQVRQNNPDYSTVSDFTIASNANGVMKLVESRTVTGKTTQPYTRYVNATIGYDFNKTVPLSVTEETTERSEGASQYQTIKSQTTLLLETDSLAGAH